MKPIFLIRTIKKTHLSSMRYARRLLHFSLILSLILQSSCGTKPNRETVAVEPNFLEKKTDKKFESGSLKIESLIFQETSLPLEDSFSKLMRGEFVDAIKKLDIQYKPSNTDNKILKELMKDGFVPVYTKVQNISETPQNVSEEQFYIVNGKVKYRAFNAEHAPWQFKRFDGKAVAINTAQVAGVVVLVALLVVILAAAAKGGGAGGINFPGGGGGRSVGDDLFTDTQKTTLIYYRKFLISKRTLAPGEIAEGLLFFQLDQNDNSRDFHLEHLQ